MTLEFNELRARLLFHPGDNAMGGVASNIVTEADLLTPMLMTVVTGRFLYYLTSMVVPSFTTLYFSLSANFLGNG